MNVRIKISYEGTKYCGWQVQKKDTTICEILEKNLSRVLNQKIKIIGASRTDSGVHAREQVGNFKVLNNTTVNLKKLNAGLPEDIRVVDYEIVDEKFHARYDAKKKEYRYFIDNNKTMNVFTKNFSYYYAGNIDMDLLKWALNQVEGEHDFKAFQNTGSYVKSTIRTIFSIDVFFMYHLLVIVIKGNGFLKQMVRNIIGASLQHATGKITKNEFLSLFHLKKRNFPLKCLSGKGLFLWEVSY